MGSFRIEVAGEAGTVPCPGFGLTQPKSQMALEIGADSTAKWEKIAKIPNLGSIILGCRPVVSEICVGGVCGCPMGGS